MSASSETHSAMACSAPQHHQLVSAFTTATRKKGGGGAERLLLLLGVIAPVTGETAKVPNDFRGTVERRGRRRTLREDLLGHGRSWRREGEGRGPSAVSASFSRPTCVSSVLELGSRIHDCCAPTPEWSPPQRLQLPFLPVVEVGLGSSQQINCREPARPAVPRPTRPTNLKSDLSTDT